MKISEIIKDKYKLRIPPTVYYDLLADVVEAEEDPQPKTGHWIHFASSDDCSECGWSTGRYISPSKYCPGCGCLMVEQQESEDKG